MTDGSEGLERPIERAQLDGTEHWQGFWMGTFPAIFAAILLQHWAPLLWAPIGYFGGPPAYRNMKCWVISRV